MKQIHNDALEASYWRIALAGLLDAAFAILCVVLLFRYQSLAPVRFLIININASLLVLIWLMLYRFITIAFLNGTIGMHMLRIQFLNGDEQPLTFKESLLASFFILYAGVNYYNK